MTRMFSLAVALLAVSLTLSARAQEKSDGVTLRVVKYDAFKDEVLKNRGKVVLVDFWGLFCPPCKAAFPHVVELSRKYESKGLVVISVALDSLENDADETKSSVLKFLKSKKATFTNLLLDEGPAFWQKRFRMDGPPCTYLFSRDGKWTQLSEQELAQPQNLDRLIEELLAEK